jgi:hypothetical protein
VTIRKGDCENSHRLPRSIANSVVAGTSEASIISYFRNGRFRELFEPRQKRHALALVAWSDVW